MKYALATVIALATIGAASASEARHLRCESKEGVSIRLELSDRSLVHGEMVYQIASRDYNDIVAFHPKSGSVIRMDRVTGSTTINGGKPFVCDVAVRKF